MTNVGTEQHPVVVGVDCSASALQAVRWAAKEAERRNAPLHLVHVCYLVPVQHPKQVAPPPDYRHAVLAQGRHWLSQATDTARTAGPGVALTTELRDGATADVLVGESTTTQLVVLGSRGLGGFTGLLLGSVAVALSAHTHCPVVVSPASTVDGTAADGGPVVVGVDGSSLSDAAVRFAFESASARGVPLVAIHTWVDVSVAATWAALPSTIDWEWVEAQEAKQLDKALSGWVEKFPDIVVRKVLERDRPAHALLRHAAGAQLVVVGSRGRGALTGLGLGSVSQSLLHHAECPVAVVRADSR
ncbi:MAG: universal stress protein [Actinophytocola sp.]|uniref:universal stress protein n=1 Tax=Actinophytocola sp. TaxID=1872138 RepID=UPI0013286A08|nr:universal stress protein [Actinophytocola sp.]MPZ81733.1 universal stress protein [Actinophytocola sp.]